MINEYPSLFCLIRLYALYPRRLKGLPVQPALHHKCRPHDAYAAHTHESAARGPWAPGSLVPRARPSRVHVLDAAPVETTSLARATTG